MITNSRISRKSNRKGFSYGKRQLLFGVLLFFCMTLIVLCKSTDASAASATISIETKNKQVVKGDTVYIVITVKSSEAIKAFTGYFSYDNRYLQYVTGGNVVHGNDDKFLVDDINRTSSAQKIKYSIKFLARKKGSTTIALQQPYTVTADDSSSSKMSVSYNSLNVSVVNATDAKSSQEPKATQGAVNPGQSGAPVTSGKPQEPSQSGEPQKDGAPGGNDNPQEAMPSSTPKATPRANDVSGSARLRSVTIQNAELAPEFDPKIRKYSGFVTTNEDALSIAYEAEDSQAKVEIKGNENLDYGKHTIKIVVTSTKGKKKTYRFSMDVQALEENASGNNTIQVAQSGGKTYVTGSMQIELLELEDKDKIPADFSETEIEIDGKKVTAYALDGDTSYNYVLLYGKGSEENFYLYDEKENTILPYDKVKSWYRSIAGSETDSESAHTIQSYQYVIAIMAVLCVLMFIIIIGMGLSGGSRHIESDEFEEEATEDISEEYAPDEDMDKENKDFYSNRYR